MTIGAICLSIATRDRLAGPSVPRSFDKATDKARPGAQVPRCIPVFDNYVLFLNYHFTPLMAARTLIQ
jgi:hypothetical protein